MNQVHRIDVEPTRFLIQQYVPTSNNVFDNSNLRTIRVCQKFDPEDYVATKKWIDALDNDYLATKKWMEELAQEDNYFSK
jgi:hypothetical protein